MGCEHTPVDTSCIDNFSCARIHRSSAMSDLSQSRFMGSKPRTVRAPQGTQLSCANWQIEAVFRMIQNTLDPAVAENPDELVVYGGIGKAARNWPCIAAILDLFWLFCFVVLLLVQTG